MEWLHAAIHDLSDEDYAAVYRGLSPARRQHIDRKTRPQDKTRSLLGEWLAKRGVASFCGVSPEAVVIDIDDQGKPFAPTYPVHFSLAHCGELAVCAVDAHPVGIDIERIRPIRPALIQRVCVEEEERYILGGKALSAADGGDEALLTRFFEVWTAKEAYFKQIGTGITNLKAVNILPLRRQILHLPGHLVQIVYT